MKITDPISKKLKKSLKKKIPKSKGTNQIGDRFKLLAHEFIDTEVGYGEALIRASALHLRRKNHLKDDKSLNKVIECIQIFLNETKNLNHINLTTINSDSSISYSPKSSSNNTVKKNASGRGFKKINDNAANLITLSSKDVKSKSNCGFYLSRKLYEQYNHSLTIIFTGFSIDRSESLIHFFNKNNKDLDKLSVIFIDDLSVQEIEKLSEISEKIGVDIKVLDKLISLQLIVEDIESKVTGFIDLDTPNLDLKVEECLSSASYRSILLPSKLYNEYLGRIIEVNFDSGAIVPTYLLKDSNLPIIEPFTVNLILLRLMGITNININTYLSDMNFYTKLSNEEKIKYINSLKELPEYNKDNSIQLRCKSLYSSLKDIDSNELLSLCMKLNTPKVDFKEIYPKIFEKVDTLVIAYNFTPFVDPSAIVVAKRIQEEKWISDIIANDMSEIRQRSEDLSFIGKPYINSVINLHSKPTFSHQPHYQDYIDGSLDILELNKYKKVYSRSFFIAAHFLGFEVKVFRPDIFWIAEFSDPGVYDVQAEERYAWFRDLAIRDKYAELVYEKYPTFRKYRLENNDNVYFWSEVLPFCFADEIIFTCENQRKVMLSSMELKELASFVYRKSVIKPQPTLPKPFYSFKKVNSQVDEQYINIAYFGSFYINRNFNDVFQAISSLSIVKRQKIKLHIYTNQANEVIAAASDYEVLDNIIVSSYLNYLDFLNVLDEFDCLFLMDTSTSGTFEVNPYLPSKLSDYLGADADIWAHCEKGSTLSNHNDITYKSYIDEPKSIDNIFNKLTSK